MGKDNNKTFYIKGNIVSGTDVSKKTMKICDGKIVSIDVKVDISNEDVFDFGDQYIAPGFIDLHIHGVHRSLIDNGVDELAEICRVLPQYGVTGFLPTITPLPKGEDAAFISKITKVKSEGTEILGFHLEGPFLKITGALSADAISTAKTQRVKSLIEATKPYKAVFSISPDVEDVVKLIPLMAANDTPVFITHTAANVEQTQRAIEAGACHATHFYDVFPCPPVTEPGVRPCGAVEAILADDRVSVDFILDGVHVDPIAVKMAMKCKPDKVCIITDANVGAGLEPGRFVFGNMGEIEFAYKGAPARKVGKNTLAGSGLTMEQGLKNAMKWLNIDLPQAIKLLSTNPANVIRMGDKKGSLAPGFDADFVVLDAELNVIQTWVGGSCCYLRE